MPREGRLKTLKEFYPSPCKVPKNMLKWESVVCCESRAMNEWMNDTLHHSYIICHHRLNVGLHAQMKTGNFRRLSNNHLVLKRIKMHEMRSWNRLLFTTRFT